MFTIRPIDNRRIETLKLLSDVIARLMLLSHIRSRFPGLYKDVIYVTWKGDFDDYWLTEGATSEHYVLGCAEM